MDFLVFYLKIEVSLQQCVQGHVQWKHMKGKQSLERACHGCQGCMLDVAASKIRKQQVSPSLYGSKMYNFYHLYEVIDNVSSRRLD